MPHKDPGQDVSCFEQSNGNFRLVMMAPSRVGLPWGKCPRMLLFWLTSEAVRTRSPRLELGSSLYDFMRQHGQIPAGGRSGTIARLRDQAERLFSTTIMCSYDFPGRFVGAGFLIASRFSLRWNPAALDQPDLFGNYVELSPDFFRDIIERPVPVDLRVLRALSSPALDIYCWLICRASGLREPTEIPGPTLALLFGAAYPDPRRFRDGFLRQLTGVLRLYPAAHVSEGEHGLVLSPIAP